MANSPFCCLSAHRRFKKKRSLPPPPLPPPGTPARRDGTLFCKLTFLTAVIVEDVVTQSAPALLPVRAEEAVICGDRRRLVCFKEEKTQAIVQVKAHGGCRAAWTSEKPLHTFCIPQFSVIFVLYIRCICIQLKESKNKVHSPFLRFSRYPALNTDVSSWAATAGDC